jgi:hypothetical protein
MGRPRTWTVYYTFNDKGIIYHIFCTKDRNHDERVRKYKSGLTNSEAILLVKIMKNKYGIDSIDINESIPDKLKYLKLPPRGHKSRLTTSWNKGIKTSKSYKSASTKANDRLKSKKEIWLNNTFINKSCIFCHESEITCLRYYPKGGTIIRINNNLGITQARCDLIKLIENQDVVCLNCESKLNIGLELI